MRLTSLVASFAVLAAACSASVAPRDPLPGTENATGDERVPSVEPTPPPPATKPAFEVLARYTDSQHAVLYAHGKVFAVSSATDEVLVFDAATRAKIATIAVGRVPGRLTSDGKYVYVVNRLARDLGDAYVSVIDPRTNTVVESLLVEEKAQGPDPDNYPVTSFPWDACVMDGRLFVDFPTNPQPNILPVTVDTWHEAPLWGAGSGPGELRGAGGKLFVVNGRVIVNPDDDVVVAYSTSGVPLKTFGTGGRLHDVIVAGGKVWVARAPAGAATGELVVIDPDTLASTSVPVGAGPYGLAEAGGRVYAMCQYASRIDVLDASTLAPVKSIDLAQLSPPIVNGRGIAVTPGGDVYIESDGMLSVLSAP